MDLEEDQGWGEALPLQGPPHGQGSDEKLSHPIHNPSPVQPGHTLNTAG